ncbi:MAG: hypothetical protein BZ138_07885 [Methanosphaera sp. rholeuAM270]|nr:MAG: hypothetical protein BZ138_07885 [Methanosphaera sp. rholeuAM270]
MEIKDISLSEIKPSSYNPRVMGSNDAKNLTKSILHYGLIDPIIIVLNTHEIIGGHQRYNALEKNNITSLKLVELGDIGIVFSSDDIELDDENEVKALNIALNRIQGEWDYSKLNQLLQELSNIPSFDFNKIGFDNSELDLYHLGSLGEETESFFNEDGENHRPSVREAGEEARTVEEESSSDSIDSGKMYLRCLDLRIPLNENTYSLLSESFENYCKDKGTREGYISYILS